MLSDLVANRGGHHDNGLSGGPRPSQATPLRSVRSRGSGLDRASAAPNLRRLRDGPSASKGPIRNNLITE